MDNPTDNVFKLKYVFEDATRQAKQAGLHSDYLRTTAAVLAHPEGIDYFDHKVGLELPKEEWEPLHHAYLYALEQGKGWQFAELVFARRFNFDAAGQLNVTTPDAISSIAQQIGLHADAAINAYSSGRYEKRQAEIISMSETDGVFGVPFFSFTGNQGTQVFWGNDHLPDLYEALTGTQLTNAMPTDSLSAIQANRA